MGTRAGPAMPLCKVAHENKILYLHGYANNPDLAEYQLETIKKVFGEKGQPWRFGPVLDTEIIKGYQALTPADIPDVADMKELKELAESGANLYGYWKETGKRGAGAVKEGPLKAAATKLIKHINSIGGVDGIVGFSQGGELACLVAERSKEITVGRGLRFIAAFGSEDVFKKRSIPLNPEGIAPKLCTFFAQGSEDDEAEGASLAEQFKKAGIADAKSYEFIGGHIMPDDEDVYN